MKIGNYTLHTLQLGSFGLDGGAMFGIVPKVLWNRENPADEQNRIDMRTRCLLLRDEKNRRNILVDCGLGDKDDAKFRERYKIAPYALETELAKHGLTPDSITDVIATHFHFDHTGANTPFGAGGAAERDEEHGVVDSAHSAGVPSRGAKRPRPSATAGPRDDPTGLEDARTDHNITGDPAVACFFIFRKIS